MNRIVLVVSMLLASGASFLGLSGAARRAGQELRARQTGFTAQIQRLAELEAEKAKLTNQIRQLSYDLQLSRPAPKPDFLCLLSTNELANLTPEAWEELRAEIGSSWHSSTDWVLLSKTMLSKIGLDGVKDGTLTDAASGALAITPQERQRVNALLAETREQFAAWSRTSVQREGSNGDALVRYTIPPNLELAASLSSRLATTLAATLGSERADLFQRYADDWCQREVGGLASMTNTLTVLRYTEGNGASDLHYDFRVKGGPGQGWHGQSGRVDPRRFPNAFQSVFPGGWREVAQREGFDLPQATPDDSGSL